MDAVTLPCPRWDGVGKGGRKRERELSPQSSENVKQRKQNVRAGNCEQTAESVRGGVPVLYKYVGCECQRGEVFFPHASDKSHLSARSPYKT